MMNAIFVLFGEGHDLDALQMGMRSIVVFVIAVVLIRVSGRRSFGQRSTFDSVVVILLGATLVSSLVIVACHRLLALACLHSSGWWAEASAKCSAMAYSTRAK
jgi:hypothetical protein